MQQVNFGDAIAAIKQGKLATRMGWNGKDMYIFLIEGYPANEEDGILEILPIIAMKTADNKILRGWLASQTDILAEDWVVLGEDKKRC